MGLGRGWRRQAVLTVAIVLLASACNYWPEVMGGATHNGDASGGSTFTVGSAGALTDRFHVAPTQPTVDLGSATAVGSTIYATGIEPPGDTAFLVAGDLNGVKGCSGSPPTCQPLWTGLLSTPVGAAGYSVSTPAIGGNDVYATIYDCCDHGGGSLLAFDKDGSQNCSGTPTTCSPLWTADIGDAYSVSYANGLVYLIDHGTRTISTTSLKAFDAAGVRNCTVVGTRKVCQPVWSASGAFASIMLARGFVYASLGNQVKVFDAAGSTGCTGTPTTCQPLWTAALGGAGGPMTTDGTVVYGLVATASGDELVAFDAAGLQGCSGAPAVCSLLWTAPLTGHGIGVPGVAAGRVYAVTTPQAIGFGNTVDVEQFAAGADPGCPGSPEVCTPQRTDVDTQAFNSQPAGPVSTGQLLFLGDAVFSVTTADGCTTQADGSLTCLPIRRLTGSGVTSTDAVLPSLVLEETAGIVRVFGP